MSELMSGTLWRTCAAEYGRKPGMPRGSAVVKCAECQRKKCHDGNDCTGEAGAIAAKYAGSDLEIFNAAGEIEARYYLKKTRLEEIILFAKKMKFKRMGLAFCIGFQREAHTVARVLERHFEVESTCCKVCGLPKSRFGLRQIRKKPFEASCNPIGQAAVLNRAGTELNVILGLCVGHDTLFTRHSNAPVTTLAVKDRVLAHNPLGAIYSEYYLNNVFNLFGIDAEHGIDSGLTDSNAANETGGGRRGKGLRTGVHVKRRDTHASGGQLTWLKKKIRT